MVSVKVDCASRINRSFLGINIQYRQDDGQLRLFTVGVVETSEDHTSTYLCSEIEGVLASFDIDIRQVYTITVDNGSNVLKIGELLSQRIPCENVSSQIWDVQNRVNIDDEFNIIEVEEQEEIIEEDLENNTFLEREMSYFEMTEKIVSGLTDIDSTAWSSRSVETIRCAAHTMQLVVTDALQDEKKPTYKLIQKVRRIIKNLRTPKFYKTFKAVKAKIPILDNMTRWSSTCSMLERMMELHNSGIFNTLEVSGNNLRKTGLYDLCTRKWIKIKRILKCLKPFKQATIQLQKNDCSLNDFLLYWTVCLFKISKLSLKSAFANRLRIIMEERQKKLFQSAPMLTAMFLDPRFKKRLSVENQNTAMANITNLYSKILEVKSFAAVADAADEEIQNEYNSKKSRDIALDEFLTKLSGCSDSPSSSSSSGTRLNNQISALKQELNSYLPADFGVMPWQDKELSRFWAKKRIHFPILYEIYNVVQGAASSQASVERLFSHLRYILSDNRSSLSGENVNNIPNLCKVEL